MYNDHKKGERIMDQERIGKFIAERRKEKGMTQEELAQKLDINNKTISRWETGKYMPDLSLFPLLSETLGVTVNDLMSGEVVDKRIIKVSLKRMLLLLWLKLMKVIKGLI